MAPIKTKLHHLRTTTFTPQNLIFAAALILCGIWAVSAISTMSRNWDQQRAVEAARLEKARLELEVEMAKLNQAYYLSPEYQELVARTILNKALEGETLVRLPKNSERAQNKHQDTTIAATPTEPASNFSEWLRFLFQ